MKKKIVIIISMLISLFFSSIILASKLYPGSSYPCYCLASAGTNLTGNLTYDDPYNEVTRTGKLKALIAYRYSKKGGISGGISIIDETTNYTWMTGAIENSVCGFDHLWNGYVVVLSWSSNPSNLFSVTYKNRIECYIKRDKTNTVTIDGCWLGNVTINDKSGYIMKQFSLKGKCAES